MEDYIKTIRSKVGHMPILSVACGVIIENEKEEILLQERSDTLDFGIPGGGMELGENLKQAAVREIREETGIELSEKELDLFGIFSGKNGYTKYPNGDETYYTVVVFRSKVKNDVKPKCDSESISLNFFNRNELPDNIKETDRLWINKWKEKDFSIVVE